MKIKRREKDLRFPPNSFEYVGFIIWVTCQFRGGFRTVHYGVSHVKRVKCQMGHMSNGSHVKWVTCQMCHMSNAVRVNNIIPEFHSYFMTNGVMG